MGIAEGLYCSCDFVADLIRQTFHSVISQAGKGLALLPFELCSPVLQQSAQNVGDRLLRCYIAPCPQIAHKRGGRIRRGDLLACNVESWSNRKMWSEGHFEASNARAALKTYGAS